MHTRPFSTLLILLASFVWGSCHTTRSAQMESETDVSGITVSHHNGSTVCNQLSFKAKIHPIDGRFVILPDTSAPAYVQLTKNTYADTDTTTNDSQVSNKVLSFNEVKTGVSNESRLFVSKQILVIVLTLVLIVIIAVVRHRSL